MGKTKIGKHILERKYGFLVIDGNYYEGSSKDGKPIFVLADKNKVKRAEKMSIEIAEKIKDSLDRKMVIKESIMKLQYKEVERLHGVVFNKKRKAKAKTREHRCVDMKVGNFILPILD